MENLPERFDEKIIGMGKSKFIPGSIPIKFVLMSNIPILNDKEIKLIIDIDNRRMLVPNPSGMRPDVVPADQVYEKLIWRLYGFKNRIAFYNFIIEEARQQLIKDWS